jgi:predicted RNase H-like HicB family nuclease
MKYTVLIEKGKNSYGAYVPDLPGCVAVADTQDEVILLIKEAIDFHIEGLKSESKRIPKAKIKAIEMETT